MSVLKDRNGTIGMGMTLLATQDNSQYCVYLNFIRCLVHRCNVKWVYMEIYRSLGYCVLGAATTFLFTDLSKFTIGRLRPHFLSLCKPDYSNETCRDEHGYMRFVEEPEEVVCTGYDANDTAVVKASEYKV